MLILNNNFQGMVKQWQDLFYDERHSHTDMINPDFVMMAEVCGKERFFDDGGAAHCDNGVSIGCSRPP